MYCICILCTIGQSILVHLVRSCRLWSNLVIFAFFICLLFSPCFASNHLSDNLKYDNAIMKLSSTSNFHSKDWPVLSNFHSKAVALSNAVTKVLNVLGIATKDSGDETIATEC